MERMLTPFVIHVAASAGVGCVNGSTCDTGLPKVNATPTNLQSGVAAVFATIGVVSVVMVVIGGLQFVLAQGDPQAVARARMTIIYAVIGLAVAVSAEVIVAFVLNKF